MSLKSIIDLVQQDGNSWIILMIILMSIIQIAPIKVDPWSSIFNWLGNQINKNLSTRIDTLEEKLDTHIQESVDRDISIRRTNILDFANSCMNGRKHTKEEFDFIISECDVYENYCTAKGIPNGVVEAAIREIKRIYDICLQKNSFL